MLTESQNDGRTDMLKTVYPIKLRFAEYNYSQNSREGVHFDSSTAKRDTPFNGVLVLIVVVYASDW